MQYEQLLLQLPDSQTALMPLVLLFSSLYLFYTVKVSAVEVTTPEEIFVENETDVKLPCTFTSVEVISSAASVSWSFQPEGAATRISVRNGCREPSGGGRLQNYAEICLVLKAVNMDWSLLSCVLSLSLWFQCGFILLFKRCLRVLQHARSWQRLGHAAALKGTSSFSVRGAVCWSGSRIEEVDEHLGILEILYPPVLGNELWNCSCNPNYHYYSVMYCTYSLFSAFVLLNFPLKGFLVPDSLVSEWTTFRSR